MIYYRTCAAFSWSSAIGDLSSTFKIVHSLLGRIVSTVSKSVVVWQRCVTIVTSTAPPTPGYDRRPRNPTSEDANLWAGGGAAGTTSGRNLLSLDFFVDGRKEMWESGEWL